MFIAGAAQRCQAALAGATVLGQPVGQPITIGRAEDRKCLLARSASARCLAAYVYATRPGRQVDHRSGLGRPDDDLRERPVAGRVRAFPAEEQRSRPTSTSTCCGRERLRLGTFDDNRRHHQDALNAFRRIDQLDPPAGDIGLLRQVERFRSCPVTCSGWSRTATRGYNIQVAGLEQRLRP